MAGSTTQYCRPSQGPTAQLKCLLELVLGSRVSFGGGVGRFRFCLSSSRRRGGTRGRVSGELHQKRSSSGGRRRRRRSTGKRLTGRLGFPLLVA
ncbi:hypothetical protein B296_00042228 [Ensete ventricosum]|uniref:Uncharacterized protein n=1 Tax=Ensete ventricosum TaxID=4639 RepID=A0A426YDT2_ENSVE|nr:hypothetical protein B296_00042228 [Ensete ventricosum]